jgi:hypothetical protein
VPPSSRDDPRAGNDTMIRRERAWPNSWNGRPSKRSVTGCVTPRTARLDLASLHSDDSLRAQTRDAAVA